MTQRAESPLSLDRVAVVIPCYLVCAQVAAVIKSIPAWCHTIVCVDDASTDDTVRAIESVADPRVVLVRRERNGGVGAATKTGFTEALRRGAGICVKMDGDGQMSAGDLERLLAPVIDGTADYAKGNRFVDLPSLRRMPRSRLVGNAFLSFASKLASGYWRMLDVSNGFVAIRADTLRRLEFDRIANGYFFETAMLIELNILRAAVADVEMPARYGSENSSLRLGRVMLTFPPQLVRGLLRRFYWRYLIEDFGVVSVCALAGTPLVLFGAVFGAVHWIESIRSGITATAGTVIVAALPIILGFQLLLAAILMDVVSPGASRRGRGE